MKSIYILPLSLALLTTNLTWSQKGYFEGLAITNDNDTVRGMIKYKSGEEVSDRIYVKISEEEKKNFKAADIKYFEANEERFVSREIEKNAGPVFLKILAEGAINLFEYRYGLDQGGKTIMRFELYYDIDGNAVGSIKPGGWKKTAADLIKDCEEVLKDFNSKKYNIDDLPTIIMSYNECMQEN
jgi:hypothetical protein